MTTFYLPSGDLLRLARKNDSCEAPSQDPSVRRYYLLLKYGKALQSQSITCVSEVDGEEGERSRQGRVLLCVSAEPCRLSYVANHCYVGHYGISSIAPKAQPVPTHEDGVAQGVCAYSNYGIRDIIATAGQHGAMTNRAY